MNKLTSIRTDYETQGQNGNYFVGPPAPAIALPEPNRYRIVESFYWQRKPLEAYKDPDFKHPPVGWYGTFYDVPIQERMSTPRPGDWIDFREVNDTYPFKTAYGRVEKLDSRDDEIHIICSIGSLYLGEAGSASISGGPFTHVAPTNLIPTYELKRSPMWNFGDKGAGGGNACRFNLLRPVFQLARRELQDAKIRADIRMDAFEKEYGYRF